MKISASGSAGSYGTFAVPTAIMTVTSSVISGTTASINFGGNTNDRVANTVATNGVVGDPAGVNCGGVYNGAMTLINC